MAVPLSMVAGEQLLACPGQCGHSFSASRLVFHLRGNLCKAAAGGPEMAAQVAAAIAAAANAVPPAAGSGPLQCPVADCSHVSPNLKALRKHHAAVHGEHKHVCGRCQAKFGRSDLLSRHVKACGAGPSKLACVCAPGTTYTTLFNLSRHIKARSAKYPGQRHERLRSSEEQALAQAQEQAQALAQAGPTGDAELPPLPLAGAEFNLLDLPDT
jgi:hypothetical protein